MKKTKILVPAMGMLLLSTAASVTGTVAWFAMNGSVTATGMTITAKTDAIFLQIKGAQDADFSQTGTNNATGTLFPVAHESWSALADIEDFDMAVADTYDNWYYMYSDASNVATGVVETKQYISSFNDYVLKTTYLVKLKDNSQSTAYDLYVSDVTIPANKGISIVVAGANGYKEFSSTAADITFNAADVLSDTVTTTQQTISVYLYFNGNDSNVYSDNIGNLTGSVSFVLKAFAADHA